MSLLEWEKQHANAFFYVKKSISDIKGIFVAYNSNIDAMKHISEKDLSKLLDIVNLEEVKQKIVNYPREIQNPEDFLARLIISMRDGKAAEIPTYDAKIHEWLKENLGFDSMRMGGQAGIISNLLAPLGIRVVVFSPWASKEQSEYYVDSKFLFSPIVVDGKLILTHPINAYNSEYEAKVNWVIEFSKGIAIKFDGISFKVPRDDRLIISSRPSFVRIGMPDELYGKIPEFRNDLSGAILSGYQIIKEKYENGVCCDECVEKSVGVIQQLKEGNPNFRIHVEFTSIQNKRIRLLVLEKIVKANVHSLGLDTVEVANALNVLGHEELAYTVINKGEKSIIALYEGAVRLLHDLELERVHIHSFGFYICVASKDCIVDMEEHRTALLFSSVLAASKALGGEVVAGLSVPVSEIGYNKLKVLEKYLIDQGACSHDEFEHGCVSTNTHDIIVIPTKIVEKPVATVGIGDTISAGAFAAILAMIEAKKV